MATHNAYGEEIDSRDHGARDESEGALEGAASSSRAEVTVRLLMEMSHGEADESGAHFPCQQQAAPGMHRSGHGCHTSAVNRSVSHDQTCRRGVAAHRRLAVAGMHCRIALRLTVQREF